MRYFLVITLIFLIWPALGQAQTPGDLVRTKDNSAVYYLTPGGKRHAFPNEKIFRSWYPDFSSVKIISSQDMAGFILAGNVAYRPGSRLIKITTDPKVYAVEPGGRLRWVSSEDLALKLYGSDWNKKIDDLSDAFFASSYQIVSPVILAVHPVGSLIQYLGQTQKYLIAWEKGAIVKRLITDSAFSDNRLATLTLLTTETDIKYADGADLKQLETTLIDTAQIQRPPASLSLNIRANTNPGFIFVDQRSNLASFEFWALEDMQITELKVLLTALSSQGDADDNDLGGLIQNKDKANFSDFKFESVGGPVSTSSDSVNLLLEPVTADNNQTLTFKLSAPLKAGEKITLQLKATVAADAPTPETYQIKLLASQTKTAPASPDIAKHADIIAGQVTLTNQGLYVMANKPTDVAIKNGTNITVGSFTIKANELTDAKIEKIKFTGFVDANEGDSDFQAGRDADVSGTAFSDLSQALTNIRLFDSKNQLLSSPQPISLLGVVQLNASLNLKAGESETVLIKADMAANIPIPGSDDRISFDIASASDIEGVDGQGRALTTANPLAGGGTNPIYFVTAKNSGTLTIENDPNVLGDRYVLLGQKNEKVSGLVFKAAHEPFKITQLTLKNRFENNRSIERLRLALVGQATPILETGVPTSFTGLNILVEPGKSLTLEIMIDLKPDGSGGFNNDKIAIDFDLLDFLAEAQISKNDATPNRLGSNLFNKTTAMPTVIAKRSLLKFSLELDSPVGRSERGFNTIIKFKITNPSTKKAILQKMTFKIVTSDLATPGPKNDFLEKLAEENGDAADDDSVFLLYDAADLNTPLAQGANGRIIYSVWDQSERKIDTTPQGFESGVDDYGLVQFIFAADQQFAAQSQKIYILKIKTSDLSQGSQRLWTQILGDNSEVVSESNLIWDDGLGPVNGFRLEKLPLTSFVLEYF